MANIIRKLTIGGEPSTQRYISVGSKQDVYIDQVKTPYEVSQITEDKKKYMVYLKTGDEEQLWKEIPKSDLVSVEYLID